MRISSNVKILTSLSLSSLLAAVVIADAAPIAAAATAGEMYIPLWLAIISTVVAPGILGVITNRQRRAEKLAENTQRRIDKDEDWKREDAVALRVHESTAQAASAAKLILGAQEETTRRTNQLAEIATKVAESTDSQLKQIHTLVNSDMTAARQSELNQTRITLTMMRKVVDLDKAAGRKPSADDVSAIEFTEARVTELQTILSDRLAAQKAVEGQQENAKARDLDPAAISSQ